MEPNHRSGLQFWPLWNCRTVVQTAGTMCCFAFQKPCRSSLLDLHTNLDQEMPCRSSPLDLQANPEQEKHSRSSLLDLQANLVVTAKCVGCAMQTADIFICCCHTILNKGRGNRATWQQGMYREDPWKPPQRYVPGTWTLCPDENFAPCLIMSGFWHQHQVGPHCCPDDSIYIDKNQKFLPFPHVHVVETSSTLSVYM